MNVRYITQAIAIAVIVLSIVAMAQPGVAQPAAVSVRGLVTYENNGTIVPDGWTVVIEDLDNDPAGDPWTTTTDYATWGWLGINIYKGASAVEGDRMQVSVNSPDMVYLGTATETYTGTTPLLINVTVSAPPAAPIIVINEFVSDNTTEWVELYNKGAEAVDLTGWTLEDEVGNTKPLTSLGTIGVGDYKVYTCGSGWLNNGGDVIWLNDSAGENVDRVGYGTSGDAPAPDAGKSTGRCPNGIDTDNDAADFTEMDTPTPGAENVCPIDTTAPVTTVTAPELPGEPSPIPTEHELGWTNSPVMLSFLRTDVSGVAYTDYSKTSVEGPWTKVNETTAIGPDAGNVSDITEQTFKVTVDAEGETTIWYYSMDKNETPNQEIAKNLTVRIDTVPPGTVTGLAETVVDCTWIQWNWTNPVDPGSSGFDYVEVWLDDGVFKETTAGEEYKADGLEPNTTYEISVRAVDVAGNIDDWQNDTATTLADTTDPTVTVTAPNGGETWTVGTQQEITWNADDNVGVTTVDIYYKNGTEAPYIEIAKGEVNDGTFSWTIPDDMSTTCKVKVVAHDAAENTGEDVSDADFTIAADTTDPTVTVTAPNGGESWTEGETRTITWTADDNVGVTAIDISYSTDGGANYTDIATGEVNDGTYTWTVPSDFSTNCRVKVVAHDAAGNTGEDESNANFEIKKKYVPRGGGRGGPALDSDGDGYSDVLELIQGTDPNDPCNPDPNCDACLAQKPAATPTPTPTPTATPKPTWTPVPTPVATPVPATPTPTPEEPGFEAVFAIAGLLAIAYVVLRRKK